MLAVNCKVFSCYNASLPYLRIVSVCSDRCCNCWFDLNCHGKGSGNMVMSQTDKTKKSVSVFI